MKMMMSDCTRIHERSMKKNDPLVLTSNQLATMSRSPAAVS